MTATHVISKRFSAAGLDRFIGEVVDASSWRTAAKMASLGWLGPLPSPGTKLYECRCNRTFVDSRGIEAHGCKQRRGPRKAVAEYQEE